MTTVLQRIEKKNKQHIYEHNKIDFEYAEKRYSIRGNKEGEILKSKRRIGIEFEFTPKVDAEINKCHLSDEECTIDGVKTGRLVPYSFGGDTLKSYKEYNEIRTPPIRLNNGELDVKYFCENVGKYAKITGWEGTHVHVEAVDIKKDKKKSMDLLRFMALFETVIYNCLPRSRKASSWCNTMKNKFIKYSHSNEADFYRQLFEIKDYHSFVDTFTGDRTRMGFSYNTGGEMCPKAKQHMSSPTIEVRYHNATLNAEEILTWASLFQFIFDNVDKLTYEFSLSLLLYTNNPIKMLNHVAKEMNMPKYIHEYTLNKILKNSTMLNKIKWGYND